MTVITLYQYDKKDEIIGFVYKSFNSMPADDQEHSVEFENMITKDESLYLIRSFLFDDCSYNTS